MTDRQEERDRDEREREGERARERASNQERGTARKSEIESSRETE